MAKAHKEGVKRWLLGAAMDALKKEGLKVFMWITIADEGRPPDVVLFDFGSIPEKTFWPWHLQFTKENPQYLVHDRSLTSNQRKYQWHVMEYAYPEVHSYQLKVIRTFSDEFPFDGVFLNIRSHAPPPDHADKSGFNEPIAKEYKRRYGQDILREDFDLEK